MQRGQKFEDFIRDVEERQRSYVFPDTARNMGGFWRGLYRQKLSLAQTAGFIVVILFSLLFFVGLLWESSEDLRSGYWLYLLLCLPLVGFFPVLQWRLRREEHSPKKYPSH